MKLALHLAYKNLINSGFRTWLNVTILAFVFVVILFYKGLIEGWNLDAQRQNIAWEYAQGEVLYPGFEPNNSLTYSDSHGILPNAAEEDLTPVLLRQGSIYPNGRQVNIVIKGLPTGQEKVAIPTSEFSNRSSVTPAVIGKRMAEASKLAVGDQVMVRWRDKNGSYDASNVEIVSIFDSDVPTIDNGQIWVPIQDLWKMTDLENQATYYLVGENYEPNSLGSWRFESLDVLLSDLRNMIQLESINGAILYTILLSIALLAIFDTQVLSIFRRQKEIGTYISLGMTKQEVMLLFTVEGAMYSLFAVIVGTLVGIPIMAYFQATGIHFGDMATGTGITMGDSIYPVYTATLVLTTALIIVVSSTIVSFLPVRKISNMNPVLALKGKQQ